MDVLPIELIIAISSSNPIAFARMIKTDRRVYQYVCTPAGRNIFLLVCMHKQQLDRTILTHSLITGKLHSFFDKPAIIYPDGCQKWRYYGKIHRDGGPAVTYANGKIMWYQYDKLHRTDGPAVTYANGEQVWYQDDKRHRTDGPAVTYAGGIYGWYQYDKLHRTDGPAITSADGYREWWIDGIKQKPPNDTHDYCQNSMLD